MVNYVLYHYHHWLLFEVKERLHYVNDYIQYEVNYFNSKNNNEDASTFLVTLFENSAYLKNSYLYPLSLSMPTAPVFD